MSFEKTNKAFHIFFSIGLLSSLLFSSRLALDTSLTPRLTIFSVCFLTLFVFTFNRIKKSIFAFDVITVLVLIWISYSVLSLLWSTNQAISFVAVSKTTLFFSFFLCLRFYLKQNFEFFLSVLLKTILFSFLISLSNILIQSLFLQEISRESLYSLSGISGHKNLYSSFIFLTSIFTLYSIVHFKGFWRKFSYISLILQILVVIFLQSRAVWIAYVILSVASIFLYNLRKNDRHYKAIPFLKRFVIIIVSLNLFFIFLLPQLISQYQKYKPIKYNTEQINDLSTFSERIEIWDKSYKIINSNLVLGVGANNWQIHFSENGLPNIYRIQDLNVSFQRPHNDFLWLISEYGWIGFNIYFSIFIIILLALFQITNSGNKKAILIFSGILGYFSISFFSFPLERIEHNLLFFILLAIAGITSKNKIPTKKIKSFWKLQYLLGLAIPLFILIIYISLLNLKGEFFTKKMQSKRTKNDYPSVIQYAELAESFCYNLDPTSVPLSWYKANAKASINQHQHLKLDLLKAQKAHPFHANVLNDLGSAYYYLNQVDSAIYYYTKATEINPRFDDPKLNLMAIYINKEDYKSAIELDFKIFHESERRSYYKEILKQYKK